MALFHLLFYSELYFVRTFQVVYTSILAMNPPESSPNLGVFSPKSSPHGDEIRRSLYNPYRASVTPVLPHRAGAKFTPCCDSVATININFIPSYNYSYI